tara:strand:+ start:475 stop:1431 length:957 start_codon:yes stop_codon:yes gene_type:complete
MHFIKKIFFYCISILISTLIIILLVETSVRLFVDNGFNYEIEMMKYAKNIKKVESVNGYKIFIHKPNIKTTIMKAEIKTDKNGFRYNLNNKENSNVLMLLGDSMTFGFGSSYTFADFLQKELHDQYNVLNTGVGNTNTEMQEKGFFKFHKVHNPKILVLNFFINDLEIIIPKKKNFIRNNFYSFSYLYYKYNIIKLRFSETLTFSSYYKKTFEDEKVLSNVFNSIINLKNYSEQNNVKFFVHFIPELHDLKNYPFIYEHNIIKNFLSKNNIKYIDGLDYLKNKKEKTLWVSVQDTHANEKTHKIIGEYLLKYLEKEIF